VEPDGERTFICYHGAEYRFQPGWFDQLDASQIDTVYLCGLEVEEPTGINMIEYLERHPEYTIFFAPSARICSIPKEKMNRLLALHPILHLNLDEASRFTGADTLHEAGSRLTDQTGNLAIITLGSKGCYLSYPDGNYELIPAVPLPDEHGGDAIGAGDSHIGSIIALRKLGFSFEKAVRLANRVSAEVVCTDGALLSDEQFERLHLIQTEGGVTSAG
jgi:sugar/nucleoside kinase (ribokinase family)